MNRSTSRITSCQCNVTHATPAALPPYHHHHHHHNYIRPSLFLKECLLRVQELCESGGGRPNEPYGFCGRKATLNRAHALVTACLKHVSPTSEDTKLHIIIEGVF